ncbi:MAG: hypothetical protein ACREQN_16960 [Candidatus Binataceae bacterium]
MRRKIILIAEALVLIFGTFTLQACFGEHHYNPAPGYGYGYGYQQPSVAYGDYDQHHVWHDRDWWVQNDHDWAQQHHPNWFAPNGGEHRDFDVRQGPDQHPQGIEPHSEAAPRHYDADDHHSGDQHRTIAVPHQNAEHRTETGHYDTGAKHPDSGQHHDYDHGLNDQH